MKGGAQPNNVNARESSFFKSVLDEFRARNSNMLDSVLAQYARNALGFIPPHAQDALSRLGGALQYTDAGDAQAYYDSARTMFDAALAKDYKGFALAAPNVAASLMGLAVPALGIGGAIKNVDNGLKFNRVYTTTRTANHFLPPPKVASEPVTALQRPPGYPRSMWDEFHVKRPFVARHPSFPDGEIRGETASYVEDMARRYLPDDYESSAYMAFKNGVGAPQYVLDELTRRGIKFQHDVATTGSQYIYVPDLDLKIRFSDHSRYAPAGSRSRFHSAGSWDFDKHMNSDNRGRVASAVRLIDDAIKAKSPK